MSHNKGDTLVRSPPSVMGVEMYGTPHVGGSSGPWRDPTGALVTKISPATSSTQDGEDSLWKPGRPWEKKYKNKGQEEVDKLCGCGGWIRAGQLEHDLAELRNTHDLVLTGLHNQLDQLKQKNRDLTFQLLMGPYAGRVKVDPASPESDELTSPKSNTNTDKIIPSLEEKQKQNGKAILSPKKNIHSMKSEVISEIDGTDKSSKLSKSPVKIMSDKQKENLPTENYKNISNGADVHTEVLRRAYRGRSGREDPRQVRSLDFELLEEEAEETRRLLHEERAKNQYLATLVDDLKRQLRSGVLDRSGGDGVAGGGPRPRNLNDPLSTLHKVMNGTTDSSTVSSSPDKQHIRPNAPSPSRRFIGDTNTPRLPLLPIQQQDPHGNLQKQQKQQKQKRQRGIDRSNERESQPTVLPAINSLSQNTSAQPEKESVPLPQQQRRGKYHRGRARQRQQQHQETQHQTSLDSSVDVAQTQSDKNNPRDASLRGRPRPIRSSSRGRGSGSPSYGDPSKGLSKPKGKEASFDRNTETQPEASSSSKNHGNHNKHNAPANSNQQKSGDPDSRPTGRTKNRGRNHRRGTRGRRKEQQTEQQQPAQ